MFNYLNIARIAAIGAVFAAGWVLNGWKKDAQIDQLKAQHSQTVAAAAQEASKAIEILRAREKENQERLRDAEILRQQEQKRLAATANALRNERDSLRNSITAYAQAYGAAGDSEAAARDRAAALGNLLAEALRIGEENAIDGESCTANIRALLNAWPK